MAICVVVLASCARPVVRTNPHFDVAISGDTARIAGRALLTRCSKRIAHLWLRDSSAVGMPMVYFTMVKVGTKPGRVRLSPSTNAVASDGWVVGEYYSGDTLKARLTEGDLVLEEVRDGFIRGQFVAQLDARGRGAPRSITGRFAATRDPAMERIAYQMWPKCKGPAPF